ncbi:1602_t:CDS:2 [Entrophospora sp. SA101]|nr:1602_t:CDS:2 [Entrophospora sp. SA101]CAJ0926922.1 8473_t:CDS:2 [Entrophospora sp. SA101]
MLDLTQNLELNAATLVNGEKSAKFITGGKLLDSDSRCFEAYCCEPLKMRMEVLVLKVGMYLYLIPENINHYHEQSNLQNHRNYKSKIQGSAEDVDKKVVESLISQAVVHMVVPGNLSPSQFTTLDGKHSGVEDETFLSPGFDS